MKRSTTGPIALSLDPSRDSGRFTRAGVAWFAQELLFGELPRRPSDWSPDALATFRTAVQREADQVLKASPLLAGLDLETDAGGATALERLKDRHDLSEFWAMLVGSMALHVEQCVREGDPLHATWAMATLATGRSVLVFKRNLEEIVWRGYWGTQAERLQQALALWRSNTQNDREEFWQQTLSRFPFVLSQVFAYPVVILEGKAYVGGQSIKGTGGNLVDYLLRNELSQNVALVELKTPRTKLLGRKYRGVYPPSPELAGAVVQVANYKRSLLAERLRLTPDAPDALEAFDPPCLLIVGSTAELADPPRQRSFELFRHGLKDVQVITYDELFGKVEALANLLK